jgi:hypothetical protein
MVERVSTKGATPGTSFWGCSDYPRCRGTRTIDTPAAAPASERAPEIAGGGATKEYERRLERHQANVRRRRRRILLAGGLAAAVGIGYWVGGTSVGPFGPNFGALLALVAVMWVITSLFVVPDHALAWRRGAKGEQETADALAKLPPSFVVLHDRKIPGSAANIDHVVIGPPGVFVVETKNYSGRVAVRGGELFVAGRRHDEFVDQARREADVVAKALEQAGEVVPVTPLLCIHRAELPWRSTTVNGVRIVSGRGLTRLLDQADQTLPADDVRRVAARLDRSLERAVVGP